MVILLLKILLVVLVTIAGMIGGQKIKGIRRFGIPGMASLVTTFKLLKYKKKVYAKEYALLVLMFLLAMGYGENSWLMKVCKQDWIVRIVYGLLLSIPFLFLGFYWAALTLPVAWSIKAGGFKIYKEYDFLYEDLIRYLTLGTCIASVI